ncbi:MAG: hypothetical protein COA32_03640 [Fluviicola sp.]|nr:MAG: hypothetical protein COA32_03640 [Fluviicola sp.]
MKTIRIVLTCCLLLLLTACATNVQTINPSGNDLSNYETFAYLPNTNVEVEGKNYSDTAVNKVIVESVKMNLEEHGLDIDRKEPDLLVLISTSTDVELKADTRPVYATYPYQYGIGRVSPWYNPYYFYGYTSYSPVIGYNTTTYSYKEGTLVIDIIDRVTKKTVWKGIANDQIYSQPTTEAIQDLVSDIFREFPIEEKDA